MNTDFPHFLVTILAVSASTTTAAALQEPLMAVTRTEHNFGGGNSCNHAFDPCLNVYAPSRPVEGRPTVLWIHGGGWSIPESNKDSPFNDQMCTALASTGLFVVSCNYYLSSFDPCVASSAGADYRRTIGDVKRAIGWIRGKGSELFGFSNRLVVAGSSAGGHLAAMMAATMGPGETFFDPDPVNGHYAVDFAILYSAPLDFVSMGCLGIDYPPECVATCIQNPGFPCGAHLCGAVRVGPVPPGYPCADLPQGICDDTIYQEALLGDRWNPGNPPLSFRQIAPAPVLLHDCSDYPRMPSMPTGNPWFDASPFFWVSGDEPPIRILQLRCDAFVAAWEGVSFADRVNALNADPHTCEVQTIEPPACESCQHAAESFSPGGVATNLLQLIMARFP